MSGAGHNKLMTLRALTVRLRDVNAHFDGPGNVVLALRDRVWHLDATDEPGEELPGDGRDFDAVAVARRLLANARDAEP